MALDNVPWAVTGAEVTAAVARQELYDSTSGAEGVSAVGALKVQALQTPGPKIRIAPGGALLTNRYNGGAGQSYAARNATQTEIPVTATGSAGGRTDLVVLRILDPEFEGQAPEDPDEFSYTRISVIEGVSSNTKSVKDLNLTYPAIALARISIPASTATITNAMITDLRVMARPRTDDVWRPRPNVVADRETLKAAGADGEYFPNAGGEQHIAIPEWATRVQIRATWMQVRLEEGKNFGQAWVEFGPYLRPSTRKYKTQQYNWDGSEAGGVSRQVWIVEDDVAVPAELRGTTQPFVMKARYNQAGGAWIASIDEMSGVSLVVRFLEVADPSTT